MVGSSWFSKADIVLEGADASAVVSEDYEKTLETSEKLADGSASIEAIELSGRAKKTSSIELEKFLYSECEQVEVVYKKLEVSKLSND